MSRLLHYSSSVPALLKCSLLQTPTLICFLSVAVLIYILKLALSHPCYVNERKWTGVVPKVYKRDLILSVFHSVIHVDHFDQISQVLLCRSSFVPPLSRYYLNRLFAVMHFASAADERPSSDSHFSPPFYGGRRSSPRAVILNGIDDMEAWSASVVLAFIHSKILGDLVGLNLRCLPPQAKTIAAAEQAHWKRFIDLRVLGELKLLGVYQPLPFASRVLAPVEMKFNVPDYSSATGTAAEKKALIAAAKDLYDEARVLYNKDRADSEALNDAFNAAAFKDHQAV